MAFNCEDGEEEHITDRNRKGVIAVKYE